MTLKEFAEMLDNREYGHEITRDEEQIAKELGFVVVLGCSDDLMELRGAIDDEFDCFTGGVFKHESLPAPIEAVWCPPESECSWVYNTTLLHECFHVYEDDRLYCIGIVCDINTKPKTMTNGDRIRSMTDEELVELLGWHGLCEHIQDNYYEICETREVCGGCVLNWLKQPAEEEQ